MIKQSRNMAHCVVPSGPPAQAMLPSSDEAPSQARAYVRDVLKHDDVPLSEDRLHTLLLIVSELTTNAYRYGSEPGDSMLVTVLTSLTHVRIEVHDTRRKRPHLQAETGERARGRGLQIVDALATRWDVDDRPFGKVVWAEVER